MVRRRRVIVQNAEVRARFEPEIVRQARMNPGRIVILTAVRRHRQQRVVDVGRLPITYDARPIVVLHQDNKDHAVGIDPSGGKVRRAGEDAKQGDNGDQTLCHAIIYSTNRRAARKKAIGRPHSR